MAAKDTQVNTGKLLLPGARSDDKKYWKIAITSAIAVALLIAAWTCYYLVRYPIVQVGSFHQPLVFDRFTGRLGVELWSRRQSESVPSPCPDPKTQVATNTPEPGSGEVRFLSDIEREEREAKEQAELALNNAKWIEEAKIRKAEREKETKYRATPK
jgi:hypothetical protein